MGIVKLLQAIRNLTKLGSIKSIEQAYKLAQREVGERFNQIKKQIDDAFNQGKKEQTLDKRTKDIKKIDDSVVAEGIETLADTKSGKSIMDQIQESKTKIEDASSKITNAQKEIDEMYRPKTDEEIAEKFNKESDLMKRLEEKVKNLTNVENISTGLTRTIAREILSKRGIDIPKGRDALEIFKEKFGQDVLIDVNNLAEELIEMDRMGKKPKSLTQIIEQEGFFDVKMPKEPPQGYTPDELAEIQKEIEQEDILLKFDPTGRKSNSMGGISGYY
jgi:DNA-binding protein